MIARDRTLRRLLALTLLLFVPTAPVMANPEGDGQCLRCHAMSTLAYRSPLDGELIDLSVDPHGFRDSVHGDLACTDCHNADYRHYPHPAQLAEEQLDCVGCHSERSAKGLARFGRIEDEYLRSVHGVSEKPRLAKLGCHACHDPHLYQNPDPADGLDAIIQTHNQVCLSCHRRLLDPLSTSHAWLPQRDRHWEAVRCIDCHTPAASDPSQPTPSHLVLSGAESQVACVGCHSKEQPLLARLYRFRAEEELAERGWLPSVIFNEAYVVGMSGSRLIDALSLGVLALMALLIGVHAALRYRQHRAATREESRP
ncbi:MAG: nitrate reductase [Chromatiaceae bacterium]|nr:nitrate reductase [Chromatiaceae bacterium]